MIVLPHPFLRVDTLPSQTTPPRLFSAQPGQSMNTDTRCGEVDVPEAETRNALPPYSKLISLSAMEHDSGIPAVGHLPISLSPSSAHAFQPSVQCCSDCTWPARTALQTRLPNSSTPNPHS